MTKRYTQPDFTAQTAAQYKANIDDATEVLSEPANVFAPYPASAPDMGVIVNAGKMYDSNAAVFMSVNTAVVSTAVPASAARIDRIVVDASASAYVVSGVIASVPSAPSIPSGSFPIAQVFVSVGASAIYEADITDERTMMNIYTALAIEEGAWTPTIQDNSFSDGEGQTYAVQTGKYTKIGNRIFIVGHIALSSVGTMTPSNEAFIANLPETASSSAGSEGSISVGYGYNLAITAGTTVSGQIEPSNDYVGLKLWDDAGGVTSMLISELSSNGILRFHGQYTV